MAGAPASIWVPDHPPARRAGCPSAGTSRDKRKRKRAELREHEAFDWKVSHSYITNPASHLFDKYIISALGMVVNNSVFCRPPVK